MSAQDRPNEPTEADVTRSLAKLSGEMLALAGNLMTALNVGKAYFPPNARPMVDDLSDRFHKLRGDTEAVLLKVAA